MRSVVVPDTPAAGIALMSTAVLVAPAMDVCAKLLSETMSPGAIGIWRFAAQITLLSPVVALARQWGRPTALHLLGGLLLATAIVAINGALSVMPVANVIAIFFVEPLILTLLSGLILGEGIGWRRLLAVGTGLVGAMVVIRPAWDQFGWSAVLPLLTALAFAGYLLVNRVMTRRGGRWALQLWIALSALVCLGLGTLLFGRIAPFLAFTVPGPHETPLVLLMGLIAAGGHQLVAQALARAEAAALAPLQYLEIIAAVSLGWLVFGDLPDALTWLGTAVIVGSGIYVFHRERRIDVPRPAPRAR